MKKYIVFEDNLVELVNRIECHICKCPVSDIDKFMVGTMVKIKAKCSSGHCFLNWSSQPMIKRTSVGNVMLAAGILYSGLTHSRVENFASYVGIEFISQSQYNRYQNSLLIPTVSTMFEANHQELMEGTCKSIRYGTPLIISGDGPGHNVSYGTYSMMDSQDFQDYRTFCCTSHRGNKLQCHGKGWICKMYGWSFNAWRDTQCNYYRQTHKHKSCHQERLSRGSTSIWCMAPVNL